MCLGIPGQIVAMTDEANHLAAVMMGGARRTVNVGLLDPEQLAPGSWVMVHAGLALAAISAEEAHETLALLQEMSDAFADQTAAAGGGGGGGGG